MKYELEQLVKKQLGIDNDIEYSDFVRDFRSADDGHDGFTYFDETTKFWIDNKTMILESLEQEADEFGISMLEMVRDFNCLTSKGKPMFSQTEIGEALFGKFSRENEYIYSALAWYALEATIEKERERIDA